MVLVGMRVDDLPFELLLTRPRGRSVGNRVVARTEKNSVKVLGVCVVLAEFLLLYLRKDRLVVVEDSPLARLGIVLRALHRGDLVVEFDVLVEVEVLAVGLQKRFV